MSIIFVTGAIGSGKIYASKRLGDTLGLGVVALDAIYFNLPSTDVHRETKAPTLRDQELVEALDSDNVIFEGWHFGEWLAPLYRRLSGAIILDVPLAIREERIKERYQRRKSGEEPDPFPLGGDAHLENLLKWTRVFDVNRTVEEIQRDAPATCEVIVHATDVDDLDIDHLAPGST